jgi:glycosyltransferase involved in cell wall biosynthesis
MKIAYITAGAAGMYCGSCMRDNTLVAALNALGHEALLVPTYTPIRTDEDDVSGRRVFFGGLNVYLQQYFSLFRWTPAFLDRLLDSRGLLRWVSNFAVQVEARKLGELTVSMLQGDRGNQRKEVVKLARYLAEEVKPELVNLTNVLLAGLIPEIKRRCPGVPLLATLQGDDIFLEGLPEPYKSQALELVRGHCRQIDGFLTTSRYYADFMSGYLDIPREKISVVWPGLNLRGHAAPGEGRPPPQPSLTIGYFARIAPEKGLHHLVDAFRLLQDVGDLPPTRLRVSGWLGKSHQPYFEELKKKINAWGLADRFERVECPDHASKVRFLRGLDVLSVPTTYREPKGLYVLEAWANGVPVVQPRHGSFPELIAHTGGGVLVEPDDPQDLARGLAEVLRDHERRHQLGRAAQAAVHSHFHAARMAAETVAVYEKHLRPGAPA